MKKIINFFKNIKNFISKRWQLFIRNYSRKLKEKGYSFYKLTDDFARLSLLVFGLLNLITILIVTIILILVL